MDCDKKLQVLQIIIDTMYRPSNQYYRLFFQDKMQRLCKQRHRIEQYHRFEDLRRCICNIGGITTHIDFELDSLEECMVIENQCVEICHLCESHVVRADDLCYGIWVYCTTLGKKYRI
jgi:hypothetical protein